MPDFRDYAPPSRPGAPGPGDTHVLGHFLRDVTKQNAEQRNFRVFGPDETLPTDWRPSSRRPRQWDAARCRTTSSSPRPAGSWRC